MVSNCSDQSSDSDNSEAHLDDLVDDLLNTLSIYPNYTKQTMTIKNRKDRAKPDREGPGPSSHSRHAHGCKPYGCPNERKEMANHRTRIRSTLHDSQNKLSDSIIFPSNLPTRLPVITQSDSLTVGCEYRAADRDHTSPQSLSSNGEKVLPAESGNNSEDEYLSETAARANSQLDEDNLEKLLMEKRGWKIVKVQSDGACLFRSISHQVFGDEEKHDVVRKQVVDYMYKNKEHFSSYITEEFEHYISRKRDPACHGNHIEIQAIAELYNRSVEIYHDSVDPINVFHADYSKEFPIRLSYHGRVHYNSVVDPFKPSFGHGLGMPNYQPSLAEPDLIDRAVHESEITQLEESMLRDKLLETEKSEIDLCIESQALRESYYEYLDQIGLPLHHSVGGSNKHLSVNAPSRVSPVHAAQSSDIASSSTATPCNNLPRPIPLPSSSAAQRPLPAELREMDEESLIAMVLEQSRQEYFESLRNQRVGQPEHHEHTTEPSAVSISGSSGGGSGGVGPPHHS